MTSRALLPGVFILVGILSWGARESLHFRFADPDPSAAEGNWISADSDGLYHARRVARAIEEGGMAGFDPLLDHPHGAPVPWPSAYDRVCAVLAGAFLATEDPSQPGFRQSLETFLASLPHSWGIATSVLIALVGFLLLGWEAALLAGCLHALAWGSIHTSAPGVADHHAWVAMGTVLSFLFLSAAIRRRSSRKGPFLAALAGVTTGILVASWTAALLVVGVAGLVFMLLPLSPARGTARLGGPFFLGSGLAVLPFSLESPWLEAAPWSVVELSWSQPVLLVAAGLAFLPAIFNPEKEKALLFRSLGLGGIFLLVLGISGWGPGEGIREGFSWVTRSDSFMSMVAESEPLFRPDSTGTGGFLTWLGLTGFLFIALAPRCLFRALKTVPEQLPWISLAFVGFVLALLQRRFADLAVPGLAVVLALRLAPMLVNRKFALRAILCVGLAGILQFPTLGMIMDRGCSGEPRLDDRVAGERQLARWLGSQGSGNGVLSTWDLGHLLEWEAEAGTVVSNFGTYLGPSGWRDAAAFFLARDPTTAEAILKKRDIRFVLRPSRMLHSLEALSEAVHPGGPNPFFVKRGSNRLELQPAWFSTPGNLLGGWGDPDGPDGQQPPLRFLRLVHVSPLGDHDPRVASSGKPIPVGHIWERVEGAWLEARGKPGEELRIDLEVGFRQGTLTYFNLRYGDSVLAGEDGVARLRIPWATDRNGDAQVERARWRFGESGGDLIVPEDAVLEGAVVALG